MSWISINLLSNSDIETSRPGFSSFPTFGAPPPQFAPLPISSGAGFGAYELFASPQAIEPPSTTFVPTTTG